MYATGQHVDVSNRFDWAVAGGSALLFGGIMLDGWAHHNVSSALESPFTPWHAVLYTGFAVLAAILLSPVVRSWRSTRPLEIPPGYGPSLLGVALFLVGAAADMTWHMIFGIEVDLEAALSPTHLLLLFSGVLIFSGPLRSAWLTSRDEVAPLPALVSLILTSSLIGFFAEFGSVFSNLWPTGRTATQLSSGAEVPAEAGQMIGVSGVLVTTTVTIGTILLLVRRWRPPFGAVTLLYALSIVPGSVVHGTEQLVPAVLLAGLFGDLVVRRVRPSSNRPAALRVVGGTVPAVLYALYFLTLALTDRIEWPVELWAGSILLAGAAGLLLSYLAVPWRSTVERD